MNWEAIGAIGEMIAALGVITSLVFVGFQLRKNTRVIIDTNVESATERLISVSQLIASDAELARIYAVGMRSFDDLSFEDKVRFSSLLYSIFADCWDQYAKYQNGAIDERVWQPVCENVAMMVAQQGVRQWFAATPMSFPSNFKGWIEGRMKVRPLEAAPTQA